MALLSTVLEEAEEGAAAGEGAVVADMVIEEEGQALLGKGNPALITNYSESVHAEKSVNILIVTKTGLSFYLAS